MISLPWELIEPGTLIHQDEDFFYIGSACQGSRLRQRAVTIRFRSFWPRAMNDIEACNECLPSTVHV